MQHKKIHIKKLLNGDYIFSLIHQNFEKINDWRKGNILFSIADSLMSAFAMFSLKDKSLLQFIGRLQEEPTEHNLKSIYKIKNVPSDTRMREINDEIDPNNIKSNYKDIFHLLQRAKVLSDYRFLGKYYIVSMDGTGYFSSNTIHCDNCQVKISKKTGDVTYSHAVLGAAIVSPGKKEVFPLAPEPIIKQDGETKNDCERNAGKRLLAQVKKDHPRLPIIIVEDALASNMPHINELQRHDMRFILGIKPDGNKFLFNWVENEIDSVEEIVVKDCDVIKKYRYINNAPLNESNQGTKVNYLEYTETKSGKKTKHFTWITDIEIKKDNVKRLVEAGRARWKIENETFNTLKNQGYHFEHNFGHGNKNLSVNMAILMMLAFLVDQVQQKCCKLFQRALEKKERKLYFWDTVRSLFKTLILDSWAMLLEAIIYGFKITKPDILYNSS